MDFEKFKSKILEILCPTSEFNNKIVEDYLLELKVMMNDFTQSKIPISNAIRNLYRSIGQSEYIHHACEFSLAYNFFKRFPDKFDFQVPSQISSTNNPNDIPKNYDIKFSSKNINFHVEVKTIEPINYEHKDRYKLFLPQNEIKSLYEQGANNFSPNLMPKISRFLKDANMQLPIRKLDIDINIVILCCNDLDEYSDILECLTNERMGILSNKNSGSEIIPSRKDLHNIDGIVICNLGFEHRAFFDREKLSKFYQADNIYLERQILKGRQIWRYDRSVPVLPMLFFLKKFEPNVEKIMSDSLFSHTVYFVDYWKKFNSDNQEALFALFNDIQNGKLN